MAANNEKARLFRSYHDGLLVLPNAWDACSAVVIERAGASAIATSSAAVSWALGSPDGQRLGRDAMAAAVGRIAGAVDVPVTADIEGGYGPDPKDVAATVEAVVEAGAAGINLEDSPGPAGDPLVAPDAQAERITAACEAATRAGAPDLVVNARTDVFFHQVGDPSGRLDEVIARARTYAEAGAACLFVPGLLDLGLLKTLAAAVPMPVNAGLFFAGGPTVAQLAQAGVRRVSVGTALAGAAYTAVQRATEAFLADGDLDATAGSLSPLDLDAAMSRAAAR
ncbi:isocitrate lyase/PEP mutase family protein [Actinomadura opuntiae]|uniref:isocitrate lyase/PEP mutase family protein n=1 Tax=Actinomadura sp. OS1-43 TaxID=604315 RepID=UPI00255B1C3A|nr:isocitrate lyase/phosphoenolpyruvate mutase family protein [Actinomadura sp. OS1-43]MDL4818012.1 isocitrate lyase/phosphoenolpyruvate mutase family protein [Actinomadura sp. OS1-43]